MQILEVSGDFGPDDDVCLWALRFREYDIKE